MSTNTSQVRPRPAHARASGRTSGSTIVIDALRAGVILTSDEPLGESDVSRQLRVAASAELLSCGYLASPGTLADVSSTVVRQTVRAAQHLAGADRHWEPLFPDFPDVSGAGAMSQATSLASSVSTYLTSGRVDSKDSRPTLGEVLATAKALDPKTKGSYLADRMATLLATPVGLSQDDTSVMTLLAGDSAAIDPDGALASLADVVHGENKAAYAYALASHGVDVFPTLAKAAKTPDDLLRAFLAAYSEPSDLSHSSEWVSARLNAVDSVAYSVKIAPTPRSARRILTARLGEITGGFRADSLVSRRNLWRRVIQACHPYELNPSEATRRALDIITENIEYRTLNSRVEAALVDGDVDTVRALLSRHRPGQLLRRLVALSHIADDEDFEKLCADTQDAAVRVPLTTSLSTYDGVQAAALARPRLTRSVHGGAHLNDTETTALPATRVKALTEALQAGITQRLSENTDAPVGAVKVGSDTPLSLIRRDASSTTSNLVKGRSYAPVGDGGILRFLCHWYDTDDHYGVDLDLGATVMDEEFDALMVSTWNSYNQDSALVYSGDMTSAPLPYGASEFIDIDLDRLAKDQPTARYVVCSVYNYSGQPLNTVNHMVGAAMTDPKVRNFEPTQVETAGTSLSPGTVFIPMVYDLTTREFTWLDMDSGWDRCGGSVAGDAMLGTLLRAELGRPRLTEGEFLTWYATAHNAKVDHGESHDAGLVDSLLSA